MRSITGFVMGLLGSLGIFIVAMSSVFLGSFIGDIGVETNLLTILSWVAFAGSILGIVGASLCFKKAKIGGVLLFFGSLMAMSLLGYIISQVVLLGTFNATLIATLVFTSIPAFLMLIASFFGMGAK